MYIPKHFEDVRPEMLASLIETAPLAAIVAQTAEGLIANHVPVLAGPKHNTLLGHVALANDMHRLIAEGGEVLAIFRGEDGYLTPNAYPTKAEHHRHVPTWNYQVAHVYGRIFFQHDEKAKRAAVGLLTRQQERRVNPETMWRMADAPADYMEQMIGAIVAFRIEIDRILAKSKLSQNREPVDHRGAVAHFRRQGRDALADLMINLR